MLAFRGGGNSAFRLVLGLNAVDICGSDGGEEDMLFVQDTPLPGQLAMQWKLRRTAKEAAQTEVADSKQRRLFPYEKPPNCTHVYIGGSALFHKAGNRGSTPH